MIRDFTSATLDMEWESFYMTLFKTTGCLAIWQKIVRDNVHKKSQKLCFNTDRTPEIIKDEQTNLEMLFQWTL